MFEAANLFESKYTSTLKDFHVTAPVDASENAAIVEAAYQVIAWLYPGFNEQVLNPSPTGASGVCQIEGDDKPFSLTALHQCALDDIDNTNMARDRGIEVGRAVAGQIIASRSHDGSELLEPVWGRDFVPRRKNTGTDPQYAFHQWQQDPVSQQVTALGGYWGNIKPFAMTAGFQFRPAEGTGPGMLVDALEQGAGGSFPRYQDLPSYNAVHEWGREVRMDSSGKVTQPPPAADAFFIAQFSAYDGTANLCAPARLYNQIAAKVLAHIRSTPGDGFNNINVDSTVDVARFYALVNLAMADAAIAAWDSKYHFQFPRPVSYIRATEQGGASASGSAVKWYPVGAQITNSDQPYNITPPFPSYPSGHAVFGGAMFGILRQFMKPNAGFSFLSDEFNGSNKDAFNYTRCKPDGSDHITPTGFCAERSYTLDCAERENADSRVFMGVHWIFDADDGIYMGNRVARQTYSNLMRPLDNLGHPRDLSAQTYSVASGSATRADLLCPNITYPMRWDDGDAKVGFGPLNVKVVTATDPVN